MPLPELIEIIPLSTPVHAEITVPGSKSITNRALILAALAEGETTLQGALWSEDTQVMVESLQELGFMVNVAPDPQETCNRTITVYGLGGTVPRAARWNSRSNCSSATPAPRPVSWRRWFALGRAFIA